MAIFRRISGILAAALLALASTAALAQEKRIALSFDDIPRQAGGLLSRDERSKRLISALKDGQVEQAVFFLNPGVISAPDRANSAAQIAEYTGAGHVIANHSNNHLGLSEISAEQYLAEIDAAELWLKGRPGYRPWFRFPYLYEGGRDMAKRDAIRAGLAERGLHNGYVTADGSDWWLEDKVAKAIASGQELDMEQLRRLYLRMHISNAETQDVLARLVLGRSPAHVLLLHETDVTALFLPDLIAELRRHGWTIISADEAYTDALKDAFPDTPNARGDLISALAVESKTPWPVWPFDLHIGIAEPIFNERVVKKQAAQ